MVANITTGKDVYGVLTYNQQKVDQDKGAVLCASNIQQPEDGLFSVTQTAQEFLYWMPRQYRTEKPVIHISLNPDPRDVLTDEQLVQIAEKYMEGMGYGEQPYIVYKHCDIDRQHIHIVSLQVDSLGRKIKDSKRNERSVAMTEKLETEYGLHPAKGQKRPELWQLAPVDYTKGDLKRQITSVIKPAIRMYRFQTMGELRALLSLYNIGIEQVQGERHGEPYRGLLYTALGPDGEKVPAAPIKASLLGDVAGMAKIEIQMMRSGEKIKAGDLLNQTLHRVKEAMLEASTEQQLRERLHSYHIDLYLRRNDTGRITGVTFIDHQSRCVLNGSRLGKEYSANAINERLTQNAGADSHGVLPEQRKQQAPKQRKKSKNTINGT